MLSTAQTGALTLGSLGLKAARPEQRAAPSRAKPVAQAAPAIAFSPVNALLETRSSDKAATLDTIKRDIKTARKSASADAKSRAREKMQRLMEQLKLIKKLYADNPRMMAKQLAALAKELQGAVKDYARAAKDSGEMVKAALGAAPDLTISPEARETERKTLEDEAKMEAHGDMEFIKLIRSASHALKDELLTAKTKGILTVPGKFEQSEAYKEAEDSLKALDKLTEDLDQQVRIDMPAGSLMKLEA